MNIVFTGNFLNRGWDTSITDENHIADALEELGHTCFRIDRTDHSVLPDFDYVEKPIDFVLISQYDQYPVDWVARLREQYKCPIVLWSFDFQEWGQQWHERLIRESDLYLSKRIADSKYPNWQWLSQDFAPSFLKRTVAHGHRVEYSGNPRVEREIDVLFTGSYLPWATERIETLRAVDKKFNLVIHSFTPDQWKAEGFENVHGPIMDDQLPTLYEESKINLSIDHTIEAGYWSDRNAQIMACGGFVLTRYVPLMEAVFSDGVAYFHSIDDCLKKIEFYLNDYNGHTMDNQLEKIANRGYYVARQRLMVESRVRDLLIIVKSIL